MSTGRVLFGANSPYGVLRLISDSQPRSIREINPEIPEWLCRIVQRLHAENANDRFRTASEVAVLLTQCLAHVSQPKLHPLPTTLQPSRMSSKPFRRRIAAALGLATIAIIATIMLPDKSPEQQPELLGLNMPPERSTSATEESTPLARTIVDNSRAAVTVGRIAGRVAFGLFAVGRLERQSGPDSEGHRIKHSEDDAPLKRALLWRAESFGPPNESHIRRHTAAASDLEVCWFNATREPKGVTAKLRPCATLKPNVATVPEELQSRYRIVVTWTNNFSGAVAVRKSRNSMPHSHPYPVEHLALKERPPLDLRSDPIVCLNKIAEITDQPINVPPGAVTVSLMPAENAEAMNSQKPATDEPHVILTILKTKSDATTEYTLPQFGSLKGTFVDKVSNLPDWSNTDGGEVRIQLAQAAFPLSPVREFDADSVQQLASEEGFKSHSAFYPNANTTTNGKLEFQFDLVPVGQYRVNRLKLLDTERGDKPRRLYYSGFPLRPLGSKTDDATTPSLAINVLVGETADVGEVEELTPPLGKVVYEERTRVIDGKEVRTVVPRVVMPSADDPSFDEEPMRSDDSFDPKPYFSDELPRSPIEVPGPPHLPLGGPARIGATEEGRPFDLAGAPVNPKPVQRDTAAELVEQWLKNADDKADRAELRTLLQKHLEKDFDANQQSRRSEIDRLQQLLIKSKSWLDERHKCRDEIVKGRIEELLRQPEKPSTRTAPKSVR